MPAPKAPAPAPTDAPAPSPAPTEPPPAPSPAPTPAPTEAPSPSPSPTPATKAEEHVYDVISTLHFNKREYLPGSQVRLDDETAKHLLGHTVQLAKELKK